MAVTSFQDLPLADRDREWDGAAAEPNTTYRDAHLWYDADKTQNHTAYKMPFADVVDGTLTGLPRGITAAAGVRDGARGGVDIPPSDADRARSHPAKHDAKMGSTPPWES